MFVTNGLEVVIEVGKHTFKLLNLLRACDRVKMEENTAFLAQVEVQDGNYVSTCRS